MNHIFLGVALVLTLLLCGCDPILSRRLYNNTGKDIVVDSYRFDGRLVPDQSELDWKAMLGDDTFKIQSESATWAYSLKGRSDSRACRLGLPLTIPPLNVFDAVVYQVEADGTIYQLSVWSKIPAPHLPDGPRWTPARGTDHSVTTGN